MTLFNWLCLFGVPGVIAAIGAFILSKLKNVKADQDAIKMGIQASLRDAMIRDYYKWSEKGYAPIHVRDNFLNVYNNYHQLGANGVMDDLKDKFMQLPIK